MHDNNQISDRSRAKNRLDPIISYRPPFFFQKKSLALHTVNILGLQKRKETVTLTKP